MRKAKTATAAPDASRIGTIRKAIGTAAKRCFSVGARNTARRPAAPRPPRPPRPARRARRPARRRCAPGSGRRGRGRSSPRSPACETAGIRISRRRAWAGAALRAAGSPPVRRATRSGSATSVAHARVGRHQLGEVGLRLEPLVRGRRRSRRASSAAMLEPGAHGGRHGRYVQKPTPATTGRASRGHAHVGSWGKRTFIGGACRVSGPRAPPRETRRTSIRPGRAAEARRRPAYSRA